MDSSGIKQKRGDIDEVINEQRREVKRKLRKFHCLFRFRLSFFDTPK